MNTNKRQLLVWVLIGSIIIGLSQCTDANNSVKVKDIENAPRETCVKCHSDISKMYAESAHFHTSSPVTSDMFKETMENNEFSFYDSLKVVVENRKDGVFQVAYFGNKEVESRRFDIALGSGEKAMTFGYWDESSLYQLPLTHYSKINRWLNSPGFPSDYPDYRRAIVGGCLECHSSFAKTKTVKNGRVELADQVVKGSISFGIDCQRCHGPATKHVAFHEANPKAKSSKYITKIKSLSRQQRIDNCAVCHSGSEVTQKSTFAFQPGDNLARYSSPSSDVKPEPDVHGNQYQMLSSSACYIKSDMDCSSCHNTHKTEKNNPVLYSQRCMNCHKETEHPAVGKSAKVLASNCIDCHMPMQASRVISFRESGKADKAPYLLRSHRIAVYPDETKKIYSYLKSL